MSSYPDQYTPCGYVNVSRAMPFYIQITREEKENLISDIINISKYKNSYINDIFELIKKNIFDYSDESGKTIINVLITAISQESDQSFDHILSLYDDQITGYLLIIHRKLEKNAMWTNNLILNGMANEIFNKINIDQSNHQ